MSTESFQTKGYGVNLCVERDGTSDVTIWFGSKVKATRQIAGATDLRQIAKYLTKLADKLEGGKPDVTEVDPFATVQLFNDGLTNITVNGYGTETPRLVLKGNGSAYDFYITTDEMKQLGKALVKHSKGLKAALRG